MAISKKSYKELKEYWDYQRLLEYNRELLRHRLKNVQKTVFSQYGEVDTTNMFYNIWDKIKSSDYEKPSKEWIPKNEKYRFEWENKSDKVVHDE